jgi:hypothetical protein
MQNRKPELHIYPYLIFCFASNELFWVQILLDFLPKRLPEFWNFWFSTVNSTNFAILLGSFAEFSISKNPKIKPYLLGLQILDQTLEKVISKIYINIWKRK